MPNTETTNEMQDAVDKVWDERDTVRQARQELHEALSTNNERHISESKVNSDARQALENAYTKASDGLYKRSEAAREAYDAANTAARKAFRDTVGDSYSF